MQYVGTFQCRSAVDRDAYSPVCTCVKSHCECLRSPSRAWLVLTATDSSGGHRTRDAQVICVVTSRKAKREQDDSNLSSSISIAPAVFTPPALRHCMEGAERRLSSRVSQSRASSVEPCTPSLLPPCLNVVGQLNALHAVADMPGARCLPRLSLKNLFSKLPPHISRELGGKSSSPT